MDMYIDVNIYILQEVNEILDVTLSALSMLVDPKAAPINPLMLNVEGLWS